MAIRSHRFCFAPTIFACVLTTFRVFAPAPLWAAEPTSSSAKEKSGQPDAAGQLARNLIGVWTRDAVPRGWAQNVMGKDYKFFTDKYWIVTHADESGFATYAHGGTYDLEGDKFTEKILFSTLYNAGMIGQVHKFKIDVEGDNFLQVGLDNEYTEKWARADAGKESQLNRDLMGVWTRTAVPFDDAPNAKGMQYTFFGGQHWIAVHTNKAGVALTAHGGTYELDGDQCTEKITFSTQFETHPIGKLFKFKVAVVGDALSTTGLDNQNTEKWSRAK